MPKEYKLYPPGTKLVVINENEDTRWRLGTFAYVREHTSEEVRVSVTIDSPGDAIYCYYASRLSGPQAYHQIFEAVRRKPTIIIS